MAISCAPSFSHKLSTPHGCLSNPTYVCYITMRWCHVHVSMKCDLTTLPVGGKNMSFSFMINLLLSYFYVKAWCTSYTTLPIVIFSKIMNEWKSLPDSLYNQIFRVNLLPSSVQVVTTDSKSLFTNVWVKSSAVHVGSQKLSPLSVRMSNSNISCGWNQRIALSHITISISLVSEVGFGNNPGFFADINRFNFSYRNGRRWWCWWGGLGRFTRCIGRRGVCCPNGSRPSDSCRSVGLWVIALVSTTSHTRVILWVIRSADCIIKLIIVLSQSVALVGFVLLIIIFVFTVNAAVPGVLMRICIMMLIASVIIAATGFPWG